jgi:hypothetical protein
MVGSKVGLCLIREQRLQIVCMPSMILYLEQQETNLNFRLCGALKCFNELHSHSM